LQVSCDEVLLDRNLPDLDAREVAEQIRRQFPQVAVELVDSRIEFGKPQDMEVSEAKTVPDGGGGTSQAAEEEDEQEEKQLHETPGDAEPLPGMIGSSRAMEQVYRLVRMVANRDTGTGKELVAGAVHPLSKRSRNPLVVVNCAAIPEALLEVQKAEWAGNVRELQHAIERAFILGGNELRLGVEHFQPLGEGSVLREI